MGGLNRHQEVERLRLSAEVALQKVGNINTVHEEKKGELEGELKVEREWRQSMQGTISADKQKISYLQEEVAQLKALAAVTVLYII